MGIGRNIFHLFFWILMKASIMWAPQHVFSITKIFLPAAYCIRLLNIIAPFFHEKLPWTCANICLLFSGNLDSHQIQEHGCTSELCSAGGTPAVGSSSCDWVQTPCPQAWSAAGRKGTHISNVEGHLSTSRSFRSKPARQGAAAELHPCAASSPPQRSAAL